MMRMLRPTPSWVDGGAPADIQPLEAPMWRSVAIGLALTLSPDIATHERPGVDAREGFERLKQLVGTWSVTVDGRTSTAIYKLTGGGRVLVEDMGGMMTTYYLDGDKLVLTHFCGAGNQPRMRLQKMDDRQISFQMFDITNLANPKAYHSTHLDVVFVSEDRVDLAYGGITDGRVSTQVFQMTRKKS
jgi:hypothetical protein